MSGDIPEVKNSIIRQRTCKSCGNFDFLQECEECQASTCRKCIDSGICPECMEELIPEEKECVLCTKTPFGHIWLDNCILCRRLVCTECSYDTGSGIICSDCQPYMGGY